jgi:hypothetical protein
MTISSRLSACVSAALLVTSAHAATRALPGAIFTTDQSGTTVNGNVHYLSKCGAKGVYLDGGPGPNAPPNAASLPDGDYYFQVTDASGKTLLSTDPVRNRCISVANGVITGNCPTGTHATYVEADHGSIGARTVELCAKPDAPFLNSPNSSGVYKVWVTPVGDGTRKGGGFLGDPTRVTNNCRNVPGCFNGFFASRSKTDTFKVAQGSTSSRTYCIKVDKQLLQVNGETTPGGNWQMFVTDSIGTTNAYFTNELGTTDNQICGLTAGSYTVAEQMPTGYTQIAAYLNGQQIATTSILVTLGSGNVSGDQTVLFVNQARNRGN